MKKNLIIFGTRPEAIKMAPLVKAFQIDGSFETKVCVTAQHREMLDQVLEFFNIHPDFDLNLMKPDQNLYTLTADIIVGLKPILEDFRPDYVYVHGDTTTTMASAIAAFYSGAKVCHVEAGLRTFNRRIPFPEEINRQISGRISDYHFAPTESAKNNLLLENIPEQSILVTGNTVIDALMNSNDHIKTINHKEINYLESVLDLSKRIISVTCHRRENHGQGFIDICESIKEIANSNQELQIVFPVHLSPNVRGPVFEILSGLANVFLIEPLSYPSFVWLMGQSYLIITDSGGVQEEAPSLGKPVLVVRETTERPEAVNAGTVILVGTDKAKIVFEANDLLNNRMRYQQMSELHNPYGDGKATERIVSFIKKLH